MTTKIVTNIEQSKKLAEILPIESADMYYFKVIYTGPITRTNYQIKVKDWAFSVDYDIPAWSLSALLNCIPYPTLSKQYNGKWNCTAYPEEETITDSENAIDAAFELIVLLKDEENKAMEE